MYVDSHLPKTIAVFEDKFILKRQNPQTADAYFYCVPLHFTVTSTTGL